MSAAPSLSSLKVLSVTIVSAVVAALVSLSHRHGIDDGMTLRSVSSALLQAVEAFVGVRIITMTCRRVNHA